MKKKVVILGAGFGGIYAYQSLVRNIDSSLLDISIVNKTNYFLFTPLLHEVATGGLGPHLVVESIREMTYRSGAELYVTDIESIDLKERIVRTKIADIPFDYLVIATGASADFFGVPGAHENAFVLKSLADAIKLRNHFIDTFEKASKVSAAQRDELLNFAIVGGGPTGVELSAEAMELFGFTFKKYYGKKLQPGDFKFSLIHRGPELLSNFHPALRKNALKSLKQKGVEVHLNSTVAEVMSDGLKLEDGRFISASTVIWAAGVRPNTPQFEQEVPTQPSGRIIVDDTLRLQNHPHIFAIGDTAAMVAENGHGLPTHAQVAVQQGKYVGRSIARLIKNQPHPLKPFNYKPKGDLVSLGQWKAVGSLFNFLNISGPLAWWIWRTIYLFKFVSGAKKIKIAVDWTLNFFSHRDITRA